MQRKFNEEIFINIIKSGLCTILECELPEFKRFYIKDKFLIQCVEMNQCDNMGNFFYIIHDR